MLERRDFVKKCAGMGFAGTLLPGVLWAQAQAGGAEKITREMLESAAAIADVPVSDEYKEMMLENLNDQASGYEEIYKLHIRNSVAPALIFDPVMSSTEFEMEKRPMRMSAVPKDWVSSAPKSVEDLAFASVRQLAELVRTKKVSSLALAQMYLARLRKYDPVLKCVVTLMEVRALAQAKKADEEMAAGKYRGPLHGIPWGAKDLLATKGYKTTWGAGGFEKQIIEEEATVVQRVDNGGDVGTGRSAVGSRSQEGVWGGGEKMGMGYVKAAFEPTAEQPAEAAREEPAKTPEEEKKREEQKKRREAAQARQKYDKRYLDAALTKLRAMGVTLVPVELPKFPYDAMTAMLTAESAAAFDDLTRSGRDKLLTAQKDYDWPNTFRSARFIPAVEYIQAGRARTMLMEAMAKVFEDIDVIVTPSNGPQLTCTNLT